MMAAPGEEGVVAKFQCLIQTFFVTTDGATAVASVKVLMNRKRRKHGGGKKKREQDAEEEEEEEVEDEAAVAGGSQVKPDDKPYVHIVLDQDCGLLWIGPVWSYKTELSTTDDGADRKSTRLNSSH